MDVYFKSRLDGRVERYNLYIPRNYTEKKRYPLIIFIACYGLEIAWTEIVPFLDEDVVMAEVSLRGISGGAYVAEAAFFEIYEKILQEFSIDNSRVYLTGFSNGGIATWSLAQAYPDIFAAIAPVAASVYTPNLCNLINVNVLNVFGEFDQRAGDVTHTPKQFLEPYGKYKEFVVSGDAHSTLNFALYSKYIISWLLGKKKDLCPRMITYRTERIRHKKAYWITIMQMGKNGDHSYVEAQRLEDTKIRLCLENVNQISIDVLDHLKTNNSTFELKINEQYPFQVSTTDKNLIYLRNVNGQMVESDTLQTDLGDSQGMGILDVYMNRMKVIIQDEFNSINEKKCVQSIAHTFSRPHCLGWDPILKVDYPIIKNSAFNEEKRYECNYICIFQNPCNELLETFAHNTHFVFKRDSFIYNDQQVKGDYLVMFIIPNIWNRKYRILVICTNNYNLLRKNLFSRVLVIPTYVNGVHPFLNKDAIIFKENRYFTVSFLGNSMELAQ